MTASSATSCLAHTCLLAAKPHHPSPSKHPHISRAYMHARRPSFRDPAADTKPDPNKPGAHAAITRPSRDSADCSSIRAKLPGIPTFSLIKPYIVSYVSFVKLSRHCSLLHRWQRKPEVELRLMHISPRPSSSLAPPMCICKAQTRFLVLSPFELLRDVPHMGQSHDSYFLEEKSWTFPSKCPSGMREV